MLVVYFMEFPRFQIHVQKYTSIFAHCQTKHQRLWLLNLITVGFT